MGVRSVDGPQAGLIGRMAADSGWVELSIDSDGRVRLPDFWTRHLVGRSILLKVPRRRAYMLTEDAADRVLASARELFRSPPHRMLSRFIVTGAFDPRFDRHEATFLMPTSVLEYLGVDEGGALPARWSNRTGVEFDAGTCEVTRTRPENPESTPTVVPMARRDPALKRALETLEEFGFGAARVAAVARAWLESDEESR